MSIKLLNLANSNCENINNSVTPSKIANFVDETLRDANSQFLSVVNKLIEKKFNKKPEEFCADRKPKADKGV